MVFMARSQTRFAVVPMEEVLSRAAEMDGKASRTDGGGKHKFSPARGTAPKSAPQGKATILCIDDEVSGLEIRKLVLELQGFNVLIAVDGPTGLRLVGRNQVDLVILDYAMPGMNGEQVAVHLRAEYPHIPILLLSAWQGLVPESLLSTVDSFVEKGGPPPLLIKEVKRLTSDSGKASYLR